MTKTWYLGIDGGGTKTAFALADHTGSIVRELCLEASNPFEVGLERTKAVLENGIRKICEGIPLSSVYAFAGIAGALTGNFYAPLKAFMDGFSFAGADIDTDNENVIAAGLGEGDGMTLILGTGICAFAVRGGKHERIAGWGHLFDEGGSGFHIARDALSRYFSACDGSMEPTALTAAIGETAGSDPGAFLAELYAGGAKAVAAYAAPVIEMANNGDEEARGILRKNMEAAARILRAGRERFPDQNAVVPVILTGGLTKQPVIPAYLQEALKDAAPMKLEVLSVPPVAGAVRKAMLLKKESGEG